MLKNIVLSLLLAGGLLLPSAFPSVAHCSACCDSCMTQSLIAFNSCRDAGGCDDDPDCAYCVGEMISTRYDCFGSQCPSDNCDLQ